MYNIGFPARLKCNLFLRFYNLFWTLYEHLEIIVDTDKMNTRSKYTLR